MCRTQDADLIGVTGMFGEGVSQWHLVIDCSEHKIPINTEVSHAYRA
jgi:hypothetical protein